MFVKKHRSRFGLRRATIMTQTVVFGSMVGVGVAALAVDTGLMFTAKSELQNAADAAALAAASQLGASGNMSEAALAEAASLAGANKIAGSNGQMIGTDMVLGHATYNSSTGKYTFNANATPYDAVQVTMRRDQNVSDGPVSLAFGKMIGVQGAKMTASATAMVVPRDIAVVVDLSGSMNDDSEFRHYKNYSSETGSGDRPGVQINIEDVWRSLSCAKGNNGVGNGIDPAPPGNPSNYNDQPGTGPGSPNSQGGNPSPGADPTGPGGACGGPRWGWMTGWGNAIVLGSYTPVGDSGLYYIPKSSTCSDADVTANLTEAGYSSAERSALLSGSNDSSTTYYRNRVKVLLGVAGWRSKKSGGKYNGGPGNGDNKVDTNEVYQQIAFPYSGGSWDAYIDYMTNTSEMRNTDGNFRYRYGLKTLTNYFLEKLNNKDSCSDLKNAPEMPLKSVKDAVQTLVTTINELQSDDHMSLEVFATTGRHEVDLKTPGPGEALSTVLQVIPTTLNQRQAGHYDSTTNAGGGLDKAITELMSSRARSSAKKCIFFLSDGKPNVDQNNNYVGNSAASAVSWGVDRATYAAEQGMVLYTVGVGNDANDGFLQNLAEIGGGEYFFADNAPDPATGQPMYVAQLQQIFQTLGGKRPVRLIK